MGTPPRHARITWSGVLGTRVAPVEIFSFGMSATPPAAGGSESALFTTLQSVADTMAVPLAGLLGFLTADVHFTRCRIAVIGSNGKVERASTGQYIQADAITPFNTTSGTDLTRVPYATALAVTLQTAMPGKTGRGRFFLPAPHVNMESGTGQMKAATQTSFADAISTFHSLVQERTFNGWGGTLVVASGGSAAEGIAPALRDVTATEVGRVYDVMTSRRNRVKELASTRAN